MKLGIVLFLFIILISCEPREFECIKKYEENGVEKVEHHRTEDAYNARAWCNACKDGVKRCRCACKTL